MKRPAPALSALAALALAWAAAAQAADNPAADNLAAAGGAARCRYSERVRALPPLRGVMSPVRDMTEDDFRTLASWGVRLLRYQIVRDWSRTNANRDLPEYDRWLDSRLDHLEFFVLPMARLHGMKVAIDLHVTPGGKDGDGELNMFHEPAYAEHFLRCWERIAERFGGNDAIYGYDLVNEPSQKREAPPGCGWLELQRRAAERIRAVDPVTPLIVEANLAASPYGLPREPFLDLEDVIYEVHVYIPVEYTHQGVFSPDAPRAKWPDPARGWERDFCLRDRILKPVREFQLKYGARIYAGEFSAVAWAEGAENYLRDCISLFAEYGWDWTYHAFREWEGWSVEHETAGPGSPSLPSADNPRRRALLEGLSPITRNQTTKGQNHE